MKNRRKCVFSFSSNFLLLTIFIHAILLAISNTRSALSNDGGGYFSSTWDGFVSLSNKHGCPLQSPNVKRSSKTPNYYEIDNQSSSLTVSQKPLLQPRAYPIRKEPFPCLPEHDTAIRWMRDNTPTDTGFLFLKTHKTASSTAAGIHLRIAHHVARNRLIASHETDPHNNNNTYSTDIMCKVRFNHARARVRLPLKPETLPKNRFLWTIVRDPTDRLVSFFFHFIVAWDKKEPTTYNFQNSVLHSQSDVRVPHYYAFFLSLEPFARFAQNEARYLQNILDSYDFIGVTERLDESLVALSFLLDLPLAHFLYLSAKGKGGFDAGGNMPRATTFHHRSCHPACEPSWPRRHSNNMCSGIISFIKPPMPVWIGRFAKRLDLQSLRSGCSNFDMPNELPRKRVGHAPYFPARPKMKGNPGHRTKRIVCGKIVAVVITAWTRWRLGWVCGAVRVIGSDEVQ